MSPTWRAIAIVSSALASAFGMLRSIWSWARRPSARASSGEAGSPSCTATARFAATKASSQRPASQSARLFQDSASASSSGSPSRSNVATALCSRSLAAGP